MPLQDALADILALEIQDNDAEKLRQGQIIPTSHVSDEEVVLVLSDGNPQALAKVRDGKIVPVRVFNLD